MLRDERKKIRGLKRLKNSFKYSLNGFVSAYKIEQTPLIHLFVSIIVIILSIVFKLNTFEWIIVILLIGIVLCIELINSSIEAVVDLVTEENHPLAAFAKDVASSSSLIFAVISVIIGLIIFLPKVINMF